MSAVLEICDYHKIKFEAPFQSFSKSEIVKTGLAMDLIIQKLGLAMRVKRNLAVNVVHV